MPAFGSSTNMITLGMKTTSNHSGSVNPSLETINQPIKRNSRIFKSNQNLMSQETPKILAKNQPRD